MLSFCMLWKPAPACTKIAVPSALRFLDGIFDLDAKCEVRTGERKGEEVRDKAKGIMAQGEGQ
jgi:hypothetical protein